MKRNLMRNQRTMPSYMMMPVPNMAHAPHNHDILHHRGGAYSDAQRIPANKSKSIDIKRSSDDPLSVSPSTVQMYEWATWRMYDRIASARQLRNAATPPLPPQRTVGSSDLLPFNFQLAATEGYSVHNGIAFEDVESDEGVFIMDL